MVFKATSPAGEIDPNINKNGRPKETRKPNRREQRDRELMALARKLRPHLAASVEAVSDIVRGEKSSEGNKLKAAALFFTEYRKLMLDIYDNTPGNENDDEEKETPEVNPGPEVKTPGVVVAWTMEKKEE